MSVIPKRVIIRTKTFYDMGLSDCKNKIGIEMSKAKNLLINNQDQNHKLDKGAGGWNFNNTSVLIKHLCSGNILIFRINAILETLTTNSTRPV